MSTEPDDIEPDDFEWGVRTDGGTATPREETIFELGDFEFPRVTKPRVFAIGMSLILLLSMSLALTGGATANTTFSATNVAVSSNGGNLQSLTVAPTGNITFEGFDHDADKVIIDVNVEDTDGNWTTVATMEKTPSGQSGTVSYDFSTIDVIAQTNWSKNDFKAVQDGSSSTTTMNVQVSATFVNATNSGDNVTSNASDTFDVTVTNEPAGAGVGGNANTAGN